LKTQGKSSELALNSSIQWTYQQNIRNKEIGKQGGVFVLNTVRQELLKTPKKWIKSQLTTAKQPFW
jgi:hypothetical protein